MIDNPDHYHQYPIEVIEIIKDTLTRVYGPDAYAAYCLGNELKYRLRAGFKGCAETDIKKAMKYKEFRDEIN